MRVIVAHNFYDSRIPSGENVVVDAEVRSLRARGVAVETFFYTSDTALGENSLAQKAVLGVSPIVNFSTLTRLSKLIASFKPDVIHFHNVYPYISPQAIKRAKHHGIPIVQTIHNYRRECVRGSFSRDGRICTDCSGVIFPVAAVLHGCYRNSRVQSIPMALSQAAHRSTWELVDCNLVLTEFQRQWLLSQGIPATRVEVRPNFCEDLGKKGLGGKEIVFGGRISEEKGITVLLEAWVRAELKDQGWLLTIAGEGPLRASLEEKYGAVQGVAFLGLVSTDELRARFTRGSVVAVPSLNYEGYPRAISEAFALGRPVLALDNDNMRTIVKDAGWCVDPATLVETLNSFSRSNVLEEKAELARGIYDRDLSEARCMAQLLSAYKRVTGV